ncbi:MAG: hypothetical protein AB7N24_05090 [Dehalococcoidia bacterium]
MSDATRWRQPTAYERELIDTILAGDFPGSETLSAQIGSSGVADDCGCGCMSLAFEVPDGVPVFSETWQQEFPAVDDAGGSHSIFLHASEDGFVHCLDHVRWDENLPGRPRIESLRVCDRVPIGDDHWSVVPHPLTIVEEHKSRG